MKTARLAGVLYVVNVVTGLFSLMYVPSHIIVHDDPAATMQVGLPPWSRGTP